MDRPQASPPAAAGSEDAPPSPSWMVRLVRIAGWAAVTLWFLFAATVLTLRYAVLPRIADFRADIEAAATRAVGLPVLIGRIEAGWDGLNPELILSDVVLSDRQGRPALALSKVEAVLSWQSFVRLSPTLALFAIEGPVLNVRRDAGGRITVAGIAMEGESDPALLEWVLDQPHIRIRDALVVWEDGLRKAPPLVLEDLQFGLDNSRGRHRFGLTAVPRPGSPPASICGANSAARSVRPWSRSPARSMRNCNTPTSRAGAPGSITRCTSRGAAARCACGGTGTKAAPRSPPTWPWKTCASAWETAFRNSTW